MIKIICVGKIKEKFFSDAINEYEKRLSKYVSLKIVEVEDSRDDEINGLEKERDRIEKYIDNRDYVITTEVDGLNMTSLEFAKKIDSIFIGGKSTIAFVIGGSNGIHIDIKKRSNYKLSFSNMTFPHQLFRIILLEQIYRSYKINNNESYHK